MRFAQRSGYSDAVKYSPMEKVAREVAARLRESGHIAYFAGGCVRDMVRGLIPKDYDIATDARPEVVVIIAGVNDVYQGRSAESVERELEAMYDAARAAKIAVVAGAIIPYNSASADANARMHAINEWIRAYAASHPDGVVFCDTRAAVAAPGQPDRLVSSPDGLHPSPEGYRLMATALEPVIRAALAKARALR